MRKTNLYGAVGLVLISIGGISNGAFSAGANDGLDRASKCEEVGCVFRVTPDGEFVPQGSSEIVFNTSSENVDNVSPLPLVETDVRDLYIYTPPREEAEHIAIATVFHTAKRIAQGYVDRLTDDDVSVLNAINPAQPYDGYKSNEVRLFSEETCSSVLSGEYGPSDIARRLVQTRLLERDSMRVAFEELQSQMSGRGAKVLEEVKSRYLLGVGGSFTDWFEFAERNPDALLENVTKGCDKFLAG